MAFNYDTLTQNCGSMKTTSDTFGSNCTAMNQLLNDTVGNQQFWQGTSAQKFRKEWGEFSQNFKDYKTTFDNQLTVLETAINEYNKAEN